MSSVIRRAGAKLLRLIKRALDPAAEADRILAYGKDSLGITQLFARSSDGTVHQLTPPQDPTSYVTGVTLGFGSASTVTIGTGEARSSDDTFDLIVGALLTADLTVAGVNGLDAGAEAANTWYFAFVIGDSTGANVIASLISTSSTAPALPAGYDTFRRVGSFRNNAASDIRNFFQFAAGPYRSIQYRDATGGRQVLAAGAAAVVTAVACATLIPPTSQYGSFEMRLIGGVLALFYDDPASVDVHSAILVGNDFADRMRTSATQNIAYANFAGVGATDIWVNGYEEAI